MHEVVASKAPRRVLGTHVELEKGRLLLRTNQKRELPPQHRNCKHRTIPDISSSSSGGGGGSDSPKKTKAHYEAGMLIDSALPMS